jgi:hypothetical protein
VAGGDDLIDERRPVVRPFLLQDRDEYEVEFVEKGAVSLESLVAVGTLQDVLNDEVTDSYRVRVSRPPPFDTTDDAGYLP